MTAKKPCDVKPHFDCNGTGEMCAVCGEASNTCPCEDEDDVSSVIEPCEGCDGAGWLCVAHMSPSGTAKGPCDEAKKAEAEG